MVVQELGWLGNNSLVILRVSGLLCLDPPGGGGDIAALSGAQERGMLSERRSLAVLGVRGCVVVWGVIQQKMSKTAKKRGKPVLRSCSGPG